ncbi:putative major head protein [Lactococcus phage 1358]|uniref:Putative major head protein n=1 Tax=Lactococcus phage 1358 TaxID=741942 RepID=D3W0D7_9CAUD|nr:major head protein [Lactococcus phage 1358]ADD25703.1 putative major head protein [Lactococcus phage 1358]
MANVIQYAALFQSNLDKLIIAEATSTFLEANPNQIQYNGGSTIKIADIIVSGLKDYDRTDGFKDGDIKLTWSDYTLTQDRGTSFQIDAMDVDESANMATAATVISEFGRTQAVPEIDAYRYATIAKSSNVTQATPVAVTKDNIAAEIDKAIVAAEELGVKLSDLVLLMTPTNIQVASDSDKFQKLKNTTVITKGGVDYNVESYRDIAIQPVPTVRFKDEFAKDAATTVWDKTKGKPINFILIPKTGAATAITKTDKVRIFEPNVNQKADAYKIDVRIYHDIIIPKNGGKAIYVSKTV